MTTHLCLTQDALGSQARDSMSRGDAARLPVYFAAHACPDVTAHGAHQNMLDLMCDALKVVDKDADAVLDEVEAAIFLVAASILRGEGFSYSVPSRAKGNQLCARHCSPAFVPTTCSCESGLQLLTIHEPLHCVAVGQAVIMARHPLICRQSPRQLRRPPCGTTSQLTRHSLTLVRATAYFTLLP